MKIFSNLKEKLKNADYKKIFGSKMFLAGGCAVLLVAAFVVNAVTKPTKDQIGKESEQTTKILGNSILVDSNVENVNDQTKETQANAAEESSYFAVATMNRERVRDEAMEVLQSIADNENAMANTKEKALADMTAIVSEMTKEANAEALIKAKGFEDCIVVISDASANVIVKSSGLSENQVAQILDAVYTETGVKPDKIKIIEKEN